MKMVIVIYRHSLDDDLRRFLKTIHIKPFTESPTVSGIAEAGHAFGTGPGQHAMILSAMEDHQAEACDRQVEGLSGSLGAIARRSKDSHESLRRSMRTGDLVAPLP